MGCTWLLAQQRGVLEPCCLGTASFHRLSPGGEEVLAVPSSMHRYSLGCRNLNVIVQIRPLITSMLPLRSLTALAQLRADLD